MPDPGDHDGPIPVITMVRRAHEDNGVDAEAFVRDRLANFELPAWLAADLGLLEAWFLERAASDKAFDGAPPKRSLDVLPDEFGREAFAAVERIVELMTDLERLCTAHR